jgi:hypothetical protein
LKGLENLTLLHTQASAKGVEDLRKALPHASIIAR